MTDPKRVVEQGYDLASRACEAAYADEPRYRALLTPILEGVQAGGRVLDLGCGCGNPGARLLAERFDVTGVDCSDEQIRRARRAVPRARFVRADMAAFDLPPGAYHAVVALWSIIHVPLDEQPALLRRIASSLLPGGVLVCTLGHEAWTGTEADWLGVPGATMYWSHADADTYRRWLRDAGLVITGDRFEPEPDGSGGHRYFTAGKPGSR